MTLIRTLSEEEQLEFQILLGLEHDILGNHVAAAVDDNNCKKEFIFSLGKKLLNGDFTGLLNTEIVDSVFRFSDKKGDDFVENITSSVYEYLRPGGSKEETYARECMLMYIGVSALQLFVQKNWTGSSEGKLAISKLLSQYFPSDESCHEWVLSQLSPNSLPVYSLASNLELLLLAKTLLYNIEIITSPLTRSWWKLRLVRVHQSVLLEKNPAYYNETKHLLTEVQESLSVCDGELRKIVEIHLNMEAFHTYLYFGNLSKAKEQLEYARVGAGLEVQLTGSLGKRTRFQQTPYAQLILKVSRDSSASVLQEGSEKDLPIDVSLQDDTLLTKIKLVSLSEEANIDLYPLEQAIVLSLCHRVQKASAKDNLLEEEALAYIESVLSQPKIWCIQLTSLFARCKLEKEKSRKVERAMMQMQVLVDASKTEAPELWKRLRMFYCTTTPPWWILEKELAHLLISLGSVKSALDIFLHLKLWEDVAKCYMSLQEPERAANVLREQLAEKETPTLWCLLGDVTDNSECYEKAWHLSSGRSARAQKCLGLWHFRKKSYAESIPFFMKSTQINSLDLAVWFPLAFSALQTENYELAAKSYRHIVSLDPESFEAWNNLSKVYVLSKQKERAWRTLQEALKCNYEEWRIWENYLIVSTDVGAFEDAIKSWHRVIEIKGKYTDDEILAILVRAIVTDVRDVHNQPASLLRNKALKLFGHITSTETNNAKVWNLYGSLLDSKVESGSEESILDRVIQYHQKAYRCATQKMGWEKIVESCRDVLDYGLKLVDAGIKFLTLQLDEERKKKTIQSIKLMVRSGLTLVDKQLTVSPNADLRTVCENLDAKLVELNNALD